MTAEETLIFMAQTSRLGLSCQQAAALAQETVLAQSKELEAAYQEIARLKGLLDGMGREVNALTRRLDRLTEAVGIAQDLGEEAFEEAARDLAWSVDNYRMAKNGAAPLAAEIGDTTSP